MNQVTTDFPKLGMYMGAWPLSNAIKMRLKYTNAKSSAKNKSEIKDKRDSKGKGPTRSSHRKTAKA